MPIDVLVPPLSQTMDSLILVEWTRKPGELVTKGEILFLVETDKATLEVEAPATGILQEVLAEPGAEVKVRSKIASLLAPDEMVPPLPAPPSAAPVPAETSPAAEPRPLEQRRSERILPASREGRILASPRARRLAADDAVDLRELQASGPRGMIVSRDVLAYLAGRRGARITPLAQRVADDLGLDLAGLAATRPGQVITRAEVEALGQEAHVQTEPEAAAPEAEHSALAQESSTPVPQAAKTAGVAATSAPASRLVLSNLRRTIARRLQESHQTTAPVTLTREVNVTQLTEVRSQIVSDLPPGAARPSLTDFLAFILARCLMAHRELNGVAVGDTWELADEVHLSLAVDTERGLLAPVIHSAQSKGLLALAAERTDLAERTRSGAVRPEELSGGTFTLTNLGPLGVDAFTPIINPPQIAILGLGRIRTVASFASGQVVPAEMMVLSLTFDHRVVDGAPAARLLGDLALWIEKPHLIWLR